jgi:hypothetical protein
MEEINNYYEKQTKPKIAYVLCFGCTQLEFRPSIDWTDNFCGCLVGWLFNDTLNIKIT